MRRCLILATALACTVSGCASHEADSTAEFAPAIHDFDRPPYNRALIFDARPGALAPGLYAYRSDWPAADRDVTSGEIEDYDVIIYDRQWTGGFPFSRGGLGYSTRTFRSHRSGSSYR